MPAIPIRPLAVLVPACCLVLHSPIAAQSRPDLQGRPTADLTISAFGGYDDDVLAQQGRLDPRSAASGNLGGLDADASYQRPGRAVTFGLAADASVWHFTGTQGSTPVSLEARGFLGASVSRRTHLQLNQRVASLPGFALRLMPLDASTEPAAGVEGLTVPGLRTRSVEIGATVTHDVGPRTSIVIGGTWRETDGWGIVRDPGGWSGEATWHRGVSNNTAITLGYQLSEVGDGARNARRQIHDISVGANHDRPLSFSRRTRIAFEAGSAVYSDDQSTVYRLTGEARLSRDAGRSWHGVLAYHRGLSLVDGIAAPFFADTINADVHGHVRRWLELTGGAAIASGDVGLVAASTSFETWSATTRLRAALSRKTSLFGEYAIYRYVFGSGVTLPAGASRHVQRQSVRVGVTVQLPLAR